jgi:hypothetical protein
MSTAIPESELHVAGASQPDLKLYAHSPLLYWWPVWAVGLLMALWTYLDDRHMVLVPEGAVVEQDRVVGRDGQQFDAPLVHVARSKLPGSVFAVTLLAVVIGTHVYLRGVWALFLAAAVAALLFLISWLEWWGPLARALRLLHVYINLGGYLVISGVLLAAWVLTVFLFDRRRYLILSTGQLRVHDELGEQERAFDASSVAFEKRPYDWFRWLVGWGAGDLVLRTGGTNPEVIELCNVVRVGRWLDTLVERLRTRDVV